MKNIFLAGDLPYSAVVVLCLLAFFAGRMGMESKVVSPKVAVAEKEAVILEALLNRPKMSPKETERLIMRPILGVLTQYQARGYMVVNVVKDERGLMAIDALPGQPVDITQEMRQAVAAQAAAAPVATPATHTADGKP